MKLSTLLFVLGGVLGTYMLIVGILYYSHKMKAKTEIDGRTLVDVKGYQRYYGKHMITFSTVTLGLAIVQLLSSFISSFEIVSAIYSVFFLVMAFRMLYCLLCKTDCYFKK